METSAEHIIVGIDAIRNIQDEWKIVELNGHNSGLDGWLQLKEQSLQDFKDLMNTGGLIINSNLFNIHVLEMHAQIVVEASRTILMSAIEMYTHKASRISMEHAYTIMKKAVNSMDMFVNSINKEKTKKRFKRNLILIRQATQKAPGLNNSFTTAEDYLKYADELAEAIVAWLDDFKASLADFMRFYGMYKYPNNLFLEMVLNNKSNPIVSEIIGKYAPPKYHESELSNLDPDELVVMKTSRSKQGRGVLVCTAAEAREYIHSINDDSNASKTDLFKPDIIEGFIKPKDPDLAKQNNLEGHCHCARILVEAEICTEPSVAARIESVRAYYRVAPIPLDLALKYPSIYPLRDATVVNLARGAVPLEMSDEELSSAMPMVQHIASEVAKKAHGFSSVLEQAQSLSVVL